MDVDSVVNSESLRYRRCYDHGYGLPLVGLEGWVMKEILALWAVPRSTSTAFAWMMRMRGDFTCYHEPFGEAWYQGEDPFRRRPEAVITEGLTMTSVYETLLEKAAQGQVFIKAFPHFSKTIWSEEFLQSFRHSFLIRDPLKALTSLYQRWPDFDLGETGYVEQRELFDWLWELDGKPPPLIDSDDLLRQPEAVVSLWCEKVGIPYIGSALSWEPGPRKEISWWDGGSFHESLRKSDGLKAQQVYDQDLASAPARVQEAYGQLIDHYQHMWEHRLTP